MDHPDPIVFLSLSVNTSDRLYDDFTRDLFLHDHRETSFLANELREESDQFRFLRVDGLDNLKGSIGLSLAEVSVMRISMSLLFPPCSV